MSRALTFPSVLERTESTAQFVRAESSSIHLSPWRSQYTCQSARSHAKILQPEFCLLVKVVIVISIPYYAHKTAFLF